MQDAQKFCLHGKGHFRHLIEKQRAAVRLNEFTLHIMHRAGKCAFFISEKFGFQQPVRDCRAVDFNILLRAALARIVKRLGDKLLARAALAGNDNRCIHVLELRDHRADLVHTGASALHAVVVVAGVELICEARNRIVHFLIAKRLIHIDFQLFQIDRFRQIRKRAALDRVDRRTDRAEGCDHDDLNLRGNGPDLL